MCDKIACSRCEYIFMQYDLLQCDEDLYCQQCLIELLSQDTTLYLRSREMELDDIDNFKQFLKEQMLFETNNHYLIDQIYDETKKQLEYIEHICKQSNRKCRQHLEQLQKCGVQNFCKKYNVSRTIAGLYYTHTKDGKLYLHL